MNHNVILYTGTNPQRYQHLGDIISFPMIQISKAVISSAEIQNLIDTLPEYSMILLTSQFGVQYFFDILKKHRYNLEKLKSKDFIVIGKTTAEALKKYHFDPILQASIETSQGLFEAIQQNLDVKNKNILFPRSALSNPFLKENLIKIGADVTEFVVYDNTKPSMRPLPKENIESIIFTSPSTVKNFLKDYNIIPDQWKIFSKGPVTSKALKEAGYTNEVLK